MIFPARRFTSAGRNPSHGTKPFRKTAGGSETRPYNISGRSPQNGTTGGASPSPTGKRKTSRGVYQKASVQRTPICTLCHGWSEPGAAVKWNRPKFCTASGPGGPEEIKPRNRILRAGTFAEGCRGISRKGGSGGGATMGGDAHRSSPPAAFWFLFRRGKRNSPRRAKPSAWKETLPKSGGRPHGAAPTATHGHFRDTAGGASPSPTGWRENIPRG